LGATPSTHSNGGDLGPNAAFALPALREALEIPDKNWVRHTFEKVIHEIVPQARVSVFRGKPLEHAANTLVRARDQARLVGNVERAQLADRIAYRISPIYGMIQRELLAIAADLHAADPELHAIYVQALGEADPIVRGHLAPAP